MENQKQTEEGRLSGGADVSALLADYLPEDNFARQMQVTTRTTRNWRQQRIGPPWVQIGRAIYYSKPGILNWLKSAEVQPVRHRKAG